VTEILFLLTLLSGKAVSGSLPAEDAIYTMIQGRRLTIATRDVQRLDPVRDAGGSITWPVPGYLMVRVTYIDQSEAILPVQNFRFPTADLSGKVLLSDVTSAVRASAAGGMIRFTSDVLTLQNSSEQLGEILNQLFEVRVFYNSDRNEGVILRFTREQLRRIEFGDIPLEVKVPVRPRYDRIFLRNGDRLTGELLGPGLDFKVLPIGRAAAVLSNAPAESKLPDSNRKLVPLPELKAIDFATQLPDSSSNR